MSKPKLPKIPKPEKTQAHSVKQNGPQPAAAPDLSMIAEPLRSLAVPCSELEFDPANPRSHDEKNISAIRASLRVYGQRKPVVANRRTKCVEAGNGTLQAALALGWTHVAVVWVDDDASTAAGFSIADNRTGELADWNQENLAKALQGLEDAEPELQAMLDALKKEEKLIEKAQETAEEVPDKFEVIIECQDERAQQELYEKLSADGLKCRLLTF